MERAMDGGSSSLPRPESSNGRENPGVMSQLKKRCVSFAVSVREGLHYIKASAVGQAKKLKAKDEKEASEADLQAAKMQVQAADEAERTKNQLGS